MPPACDAALLHRELTYTYALPTLYSHVPHKNLPTIASTHYDVLLTGMEQGAEDGRRCNESELRPSVEVLRPDAHEAGDIFIAEG